MNKLKNLLMASAIAVAATSCVPDPEPKIIDNSTTTITVTINGHKFIDLGLPSGTLWAETNVGASTPYEDGDYFAWAETKPKSSYSLDNRKDNVNKYKDGKTTLDAADDAATANWGTGCRMPSTTEMNELKSKCTWTWKSNYNGASGYLVKGSNGNSIFLPASGLRDEDNLEFHGSEGNYWSSQALKIGKYDAQLLSFSNNDVDIASSDNYLGFSVRPVSKKSDNKSDNDSSDDEASQDDQDDNTSTDGLEHKLVDLGLPSGLLWAETNIGASTPYEEGDYFAWGETKPKRIYTKDSYKWGRTPGKYNSSDYKIVLDNVDDAASINLGSKYRMPTSNEFQELKTKCTWTWQNNYNGTKGYIVTGCNGKSIFLPAAGYRQYDYENPSSKGISGCYFSKSLHSNNSFLYAYSLEFNCDEINLKGYYRHLGFSIRPVSDK